MTSDILGVSVSGLRVSQNALRTVGHNIANANTEGYSRQTTDISSLNAMQGGGAGFLGSGAFTENIERVVNEFVTSQMRQDTTLYSELNAYNQHIIQVNDLFSNETTGLTQGLQSFFSAVQTVADDPTSSAARQLFVSEANNLGDRFNTISSRLDDINNGVLQGVEVAVQNINNLSDNIATLNSKIAEFSGASNSSPNDLLDQRDLALRQLSELVAVNISTQDDNQINLTIGNGIPLVLGSNATHVVLGQNEYDPRKPEIFLNSNTVTQSITSSFTGGEIGGLLNFQETVVDPAYNDMGRIALSVADNFNQLQRQGLTLNNTFGSDLFTSVNDASFTANRIVPSSNNTGSDISFTVNISDTSVLTTSDYMLRVNDNAGVYSITRLSDNTELASALIPTTFPSTITFDGLSLDINSGGFAGGDTFLIQPTRLAASGFSANALHVDDVALASPIKTDSAIGNLGNASISAGEVLSLSDVNGQTLPLLAQQGQMSPPLIVKFTTATTYDVLDNSDPGNPVQLSPPVRHQTYVPGIENNLFSNDQGETTVVTNGSVLGLPAGSTQATQASVKPSAVAPTFAGIDFSTTANQFSFDVVVANTSGGTYDGTYTVTIDDASITSNTQLLAAINDDLTASGVTAYITDTAQGSALAFAATAHGVGDITLQNYNGDPDLNLDTAPVGQANTLFGFDIEGTTFTTVANANGISGIGITTNNYPAETLTITTTDPITAIETTQSLTTTANASARTTASQLDNLTGVNANAYNYIEFRSASLTLSSPLQLSLNGESLIAYESGSISGSVPSPSLNASEDFNDYLAQTINSNTNLQALGIYAVSAYDAVADEFYVKVTSTLGDDFDIELTTQASGGGSIAVNDGVNSNVTLTGSGTNTTSQLVVGGRIDVTLSDNVSLSTTPVISTLFGDSSGASFAQTSYRGIQASISGTPQSGDEFSIDFNTDAALDNRNALLMAGLQQSQTVEGGSQSFQEAYNQLVENVGIKANTSQNNTNAAQNVLEQTTGLRDSISGVNLDEEAADLIKYEQLYSANAQVITVARDLFDRLLNSF